ncbi:MAG: peptidylprolyl isomerase [bacterium]|nr:peptidylprolyl isomerase [bacterium]
MTDQNQVEKVKSGKKLFAWLSGAGIIILIAASAGVMILGVYKYPWQNKILSGSGGGWQSKMLTTAINSFPFPIAASNIESYDWKNPQGIFAFRFIAIKEWEQTVSALKNYYEKQGTDFSAEEGKAQFNQLQAAVLEKMISDKIVADLAAEKGIAVSAEEIAGEIEKAKASLGSEEEIKKTVQEMYGWDLDQFKQKIIVPYLQQTKLSEKVFDGGRENEEARKKAEEVLAKVKTPGANFEDLAREYSEDTYSAPSGGDLGSFSRGQMTPAFEDAAFALAPGEISDLVQTEYGYHIIKVEDKGKLDTGDEQVRARHILIRTIDPAEWFQGWLEEQKAKMKIYKFINLE